MYMLRIISIRSSGNCNSSPMTYHNFSLFIESYALRRSMNANPSCCLVLMLCWMMVYRISACSVVVWCARNPAWVGAWRLRLHKYFGKGGRDGDATVIFRVCSVAFAFVQWYYFGCSPRGGWCLVYSTGI